MLRIKCAWCDFFLTSRELNKYYNLRIDKKDLLLVFHISIIFFGANKFYFIFLAERVVSVCIHKFLLVITRLLIFIIIAARAISVTAYLPRLFFFFLSVSFFVDFFCIVTAQPQQLSCVALSLIVNKFSPAPRLPLSSSLHPARRPWGDLSSSLDEKEIDEPRMSYLQSDPRILPKLIFPLL